jgi:hypothetical protein
VTKRRKKEKDTNHHPTSIDRLRRSTHTAQTTLALLEVRKESSILLLVTVVGRMLLLLTRHSLLVLLVLLVVIACCGGGCHAWILLPNTKSSTRKCSVSSSASRSSWSSSSRLFNDNNGNGNGIVDAEFERVVVVNKEEEKQTSQPIPDDDDEEERPKTLLDLSLESGDPQWNQARIAFTRGNDYIDGKLAFTVALEGVQYGIAVPFDDPVAIVQEITKDDDDSNKNSEVLYIDPDDENYNENNDEHQELMEIMAAQVQEQLGEEYQLRKTPKVLTISGGLGKLTDHWERDLMPKSATIEELMEQDMEEDEEIAEFYKFMKQELGEEEFEKTMKEELSDEDKEMAKFFDIPGLGTQKDDLVGLEAMMQSIADDVENENGGVEQAAKEFQPNTDGVSLKLIGFNFADGSGKSYSLVKLLQPYVLIGKYIEDEQDDIRFELLTPEEEKVLIPKLEDLCQEDLQAAGLTLPKSEP